MNMNTESFGFNYQSTASIQSTMDSTLSSSVSRSRSHETSIMNTIDNSQDLVQINNRNRQNVSHRRRIMMFPSFITVAAIFLMCRCSEAFASKSHSGLFGKRLFHHRGGSAQQQQQQSSSSTSKITCVLQAPPPLQASLANGNPDQPRNNKRNGVSKNSVTFAAGIAANGKTAAAPADSYTETEYVAETKLPTDIGQFQLRAYRVPGAPLGQEPCVIYCRDKPPFGTNGEPVSGVPVRIHDQCLTSEVFRSQRCDCKEQLNMALHYIKKNGGFIIYLQQEGRGIGLANKIAAYALQDVGLDTVDANLHLGFPEDMREYGVVPSILQDMKVDSIQLMTNNPRKVERLERLGVNVERTLPMVVPTTNPYNHKYMRTKRDRMNHSNLATLLSQDPIVNGYDTKNGVGKKTNNNVVMIPRKHLADQYINNGTEMSANAVQVSLMLDEEEVEEEGVKAQEDGYCFGRQSVVDAIAAVKRGEMVVVVDDMNRENEGDFIMAADRCTDLDMARIVRYSSGVVCVAMEEKRLNELKLPPMVENNEDPKGTAFTVSVDATKEHGITTGISASDRAKTVRLLADPNSKDVDFHRPGHLFPLRAREGGVLTRDGHTEAAIDLARLAGLNPCGILCEIVSEENPTEMMRLPELKRFAKRHGFIITSIVDLIQYRKETRQ